MAHIRKQVRDRAKLILTAALPDDEIAVGRVKPAEKAKRVSIAVYTNAEQAREDEMGGGQTRNIAIRVDIATKGSEEDALDRLDAKAVEIEQAFALDPTLGGLAAASEYRGTTTVPTMDAETPFTVMTMTFDAMVFTQKADPETSTGD